MSNPEPLPDPFIQTSKPNNPTSPSAARPKHLTTRSVSEIHPQKHHKHHNPLHAHHHRRKEERESGSQSAHPNLQEGTYARSDGPSLAGGSREVSESRRGSAGGLGLELPAYGAGGDGERETGRRVVREEEVREERERGVLRAAELRNSLLGLNTLSVSMTRRLDNTYYSVLEKLSTLQNTITSLKELANMMRNLNQDFKSEAEEVVRDINIQLSTLSDFSSQETRIAGLAQRVSAGREKITGLGKRVDAVQERVVCWEQGEKEWKDRTRKRLRIMWSCMFVVGLLVMGMVWWWKTPSKTFGPSVYRGLNTSGLIGKVPELEEMGENGTGVWGLKRREGDGLEELRRGGEGERTGEDPRLRIFDEL